MKEIELNSSKAKGERVFKCCDELVVKYWEIGGEIGLCD